MDEYRGAKLRIFMNQTSEDYAVVNVRESLPPIAARKITFSAYDPEADFTLRDGVIHYRNEPVLDQRKTRLAGIHNAENLMAALGVGLALGVDFERMAAAVGEYTAPVHRCEFVRDLEGVRWINDSKATNLDSVEKAILSQSRPIVLIAGGKDKGFEFDSIAPLVRERVRVAVLIGEMKERIARSWSGVDCRISASLEEAVEVARGAANDGDAVLLSPGTSSYDMFRNYGERGNRFKDAVNALK
jgi:UDP-N-acetylmuramoylalanine--D-glutamate ligase